MTLKPSGQPPGPLTLARVLREKSVVPGGALGAWCSTSSTYAAEVLARSGADWLGIDLQHGLSGPESAVAMLQAGALGGVPAIVRVGVEDWLGVGRVLDAGAAGVIVPMVDDVETAQRAVAACRYPPNGKRSWGTTRAAFGEAQFAPDLANRDIVLLAMIETREAHRNLRAILDVDGVDGVFVGPSDLGISLGVGPGLDVTDSGHEGVIRDIAEACVERQLIAGIFAGSPKATLRWSEMGYGLVVVQSDAGLLRQGIASSMVEAQDLLQRESSVHS